MPRDYAKNSRASANRTGTSGLVLLLFGVLIGLIIGGVVYLKQGNRTNSAATTTTLQTATGDKVIIKPPATNNSANTTQNLQTQFDFYNTLPSEKVVGPSGDEDTSQINNENQGTPPPASATSAPTANAAAASSTAPTTSMPTNTAPTASNPTTATNTAPVTSSAPASSATTTTTTPVTTAATPTTASASTSSNTTSSTAAASENTSPPATASNTGTTAAAAATQYILQLGTFSQYDAADQLRAQLTLSGFEVNITAIQKNGATLQRVWMGPYPSLSAAQAMQKQLQASQISSKLLKSS